MGSRFDYLFDEANQDIERAIALSLQDQQEAARQASTTTTPPSTTGDQHQQRSTLGEGVLQAAQEPPGGEEDNSSSSTNPGGNRIDDHTMISTGHQHQHHTEILIPPTVEEDEEFQRALEESRLLYAQEELSRRQMEVLDHEQQLPSSSSAATLSAGSSTGDLAPRASQRTEPASFPALALPQISNRRARVPSSTSSVSVITPPALIGGHLSAASIRTMPSTPAAIARNCSNRNIIDPTGFRVQILVKQDGSPEWRPLRSDKHEVDATGSISSFRVHARDNTVYQIRCFSEIVKAVVTCHVDGQSVLLKESDFLPIYAPDKPKLIPGFDTFMVHDKNTGSRTTQYREFVFKLGDNLQDNSSRSRRSPTGLDDGITTAGPRVTTPMAGGAPVPPGPSIIVNFYELIEECQYYVDAGFHGGGGGGKNKQGGCSIQTVSRELSDQSFPPSPFNNNSNNMLGIGNANRNTTGKKKEKHIKSAKKSKRGDVDKNGPPGDYGINQDATSSHLRTGLGDMMEHTRGGNDSNKGGGKGNKGFIGKNGKMMMKNNKISRGRLLHTVVVTAQKEVLFWHRQLFLYEDNVGLGQIPAPVLPPLREVGRSPASFSSSSQAEDPTTDAGRLVIVIDAANVARYDDGICSSSSATLASPARESSATGTSAAGGHTSAAAAASGSSSGSADGREVIDLTGEAGTGGERGDVIDLTGEQTGGNSAADQRRINVNVSPTSSATNSPGQRHGDGSSPSQNHLPPFQPEKLRKMVQFFQELLIKNFSENRINLTTTAHIVIGCAAGDMPGLELGKLRTFFNNVADRTSSHHVCALKFRCAEYGAGSQNVDRVLLEEALRPDICGCLVSNDKFEDHVNNRVVSGSMVEKIRVEFGFFQQTELLVYAPNFWEEHMNKGGDLDREEHLIDFLAEKLTPTSYTLGGR
ncbi:unnamed protein product [Amoebophrya sp. A120]|nr:unnamed protein product [Amoebophrya sp. A120]|eukprot:GSA120T00013708001.1